MADDEFFTLQETESLFIPSGISLDDMDVELSPFYFEIPDRFFSYMDEAKVSYELMIQVSDKLQFAYQDLLRKIEVIK